jgi:hypothetical protein
MTPRGRPFAWSPKHEYPAKGQRSRPSHPRVASQIGPEIYRIVELANDRMSAAIGVRSCSVRDPLTTIGGADAQVHDGVHWSFRSRNR